MRQRNVSLGIALGIGMATIYSVVAVLIYLVGGGAAASEGGAAALEYSIFAVLAAYWLGGIVGGAMLGALLPYTTSRFRSTIIGIPVAIPAVVGIIMALSGPPTLWGGAELFASITMSLIFGAWGGYYFWSPPGASGV